MNLGTLLPSREVKTEENGLIWRAVSSCVLRTQCSQKRGENRKRPFLSRMDDSHLIAAYHTCVHVYSCLHIIPTLEQPRFCGTILHTRYLVRVSRVSPAARRRLCQRDLSVPPRLHGKPPGLVRSCLRGLLRGLEPIVSGGAGGVRAHANSRQARGPSAVASGQEHRGSVFLAQWGEGGRGIQQGNEKVSEEKKGVGHYDIVSFGCVAHL